jgi:hypothetical protein
MSAYQLAQLNIAKMKYVVEAPEMADFVNNLERVNALAEQSPGFIWRLQTEEGDATSIRAFGPDILVNMSIWKDVESLHNFVYRTAHTSIMRRRKEWFERISEAYAVLWWIPVGRYPELEEAKEKLEYLKAHGPSASAFTFKKAYPAPDIDGAGTDLIDEFDDLCPVT